jgi:D-ribose pyranose/furanose isomerase RbsD
LENYIEFKPKYDQFYV